jgi:hypothetical protein
MSDKISYILEVLDGYSVTTTKFKKQIDLLSSSVTHLNKQLDLIPFKFNKINSLNLGRSISQYNKMTSAIDSMSSAEDRIIRRRQTRRFSLLEGGSQSLSLSGAEIRRRRSMQNALVPYSYPFTTPSGINSLGRYRPNFSIPRNGTYSKSYFGTTAVVPYQPAGGQLSSFGNSYKGRTFEGSYQDISSPPSQQSPFNGRGGRGAVMAGVVGAGMMSNVKPFLNSMGILTGVYAVGKSVRYVHDTTVQMDSLRASLSALIPKVKGLENATPEGEIKYLRGVSDTYGLNFSDIAPSYVKMLGTGGDIDAGLAKGLTEKVGGYGSLMGLTSPAMKDTMRGFQDMLTKQVLNAQEVTLQMQQLTGGKAMLATAFRRVATRSGITGITPENEGAKFAKAMSYGTLKSAPILREFTILLEEIYGKDMLEKAFKLGNEERRLESATQELATSFGDLTYGMQIGVVRGLTDVTKGVNSFTKDLQYIGDYFNNKQQEREKNWLGKLRQDNPDPYGLKPVGNFIGTGLNAANEVAKLPINTLYEALIGAVIGDWSQIATPAGEFNKFGASIFDGGVKALAGIFDVSFGEPLKKLIDILIQRESSKQQVEVKITAENIPDMFTIKQGQNMSTWKRPSTVIAGSI